MMTHGDVSNLRCIIEAANLLCVHAGRSIGRANQIRHESTNHNRPYLARGSVAFDSTIGRAKPRDFATAKRRRYSNDRSAELPWNIDARQDAW